MPVLKAQNERVVAHSHTMDAHDAYQRSLRGLAEARGRKKPLKPVQMAALRSHMNYLRVAWLHRKALEQVKQAELRLAQSTLAKKHKLAGYRSVSESSRLVAAARKHADASRKRVDESLARSRAPDAWRASKKTSHNRESRLVAAIEFFETMSTIIAKSKHNCRIMAQGLSSLFNRRADMVYRLRDAPDTPFQKIHERHNRFRARADAATKKMMNGIAACIRNKRVKQLLERLSPRRAP